MTAAASRRASGGLGRVKRGVGAFEQLVDVDFAAIESGDAKTRGDAQLSVLALDPRAGDTILSVSVNAQGNPDAGILRADNTTLGIAATMALIDSALAAVEDGALLSRRFDHSLQLSSPYEVVDGRSAYLTRDGESNAADCTNLSSEAAADQQKHKQTNLRERIGENDLS